MTKTSQDNNWIIISIIALFSCSFYEYLTEKLKLQIPIMPQFKAFDQMNMQYEIRIC